MAATSTRSRLASRAISMACEVVITPSCSPPAPIRRIGLIRICSLTRGPRSRSCGRELRSGGRIRGSPWSLECSTVGRLPDRRYMDRPRLALVLEECAVLPSMRPRHAYRRGRSSDNLAPNRPEGKGEFSRSLPLLKRRETLRLGAVGSVESGTATIRASVTWTLSGSI